MFIRALALTAALFSIGACTIQLPLSDHSPVLLSQTPDAEPQPADEAAGENHQLGNPGAVPR